MSTGVPGAGGKEPLKPQPVPGQRQPGAPMPAPTGMPAPGQAGGMGQRAVSPQPEAAVPAAAAAVTGDRITNRQINKWGLGDAVFFLP